MKPIEKDELYEHLRGFLKTKGVELKDGSYSQTIQKSCSILADAINLSQRGIEKAKTGIDEQIDKMRQVIHEKTARKTSAARDVPTAASAPPASAPAPPSMSTSDNSATPKLKRKKPVTKKRTTRRGKR